MSALRATVLAVLLASLALAKADSVGLGLDLGPGDGPWEEALPSEVGLDDNLLKKGR